MNLSPYRIVFCVGERIICFCLFIGALNGAEVEPKGFSCEYSGSPKIRTRVCSHFLWKSLFFGEVVLGKTWNSLFFGVLLFGEPLYMPILVQSIYMLNMSGCICGPCMCLIHIVWPRWVISIYPIFSEYPI